MAKKTANQSEVITIISNMSDGKGVMITTTIITFVVFLLLVA